MQVKQINVQYQFLDFTPKFGWIRNPWNFCNLFMKIYSVSILISFLVSWFSHLPLILILKLWTMYCICKDIVKNVFFYHVSTLSIQLRQVLPISLFIIHVQISKILASFCTYICNNVSTYVLFYNLFT